MSDLGLVFSALRFSARAHRRQQRKNEEPLPYINHPIEVAHLLVEIGGVSDPEVLAAALLHDTLEDTAVEGAELEKLFGARVRRLVEEVSDDPELGSRERKRLQVERAPHLSHGARLVKLADKIANVFDIAHAPPAGWPEERRRDYLDWTEAVVDRLRGTNEALESHYDRLLAEARAALSAGPAPRS